MTSTASITSAGGNITLTADKMALNGGAGTESIATSGTGGITLKPLTAGVAVNLGSAGDTTPITLELGPTELDTITAGTLTIGGAASGIINVSAVIAPLSFKTLALAQNTIFAAAGGFTADVTSSTVFEKMTVTGTVSITAGALFTANAVGYTWNGTHSFTFLANDSTDAISGTFTGPTLTNFLGSTLTAAQSYTAGTGNDFVVGPPPPPTGPTPFFLGSAGTTGSGTGGGIIEAPDATASASLGRWESIRTGAVLASNGSITFRGHMELNSGAPPVTANDFQGIWKYNGTDTRLKARSGTAAPGTGGALYDMLALNPTISPGGLITFFGTLRLNTGAPQVTNDNNYGLWSELGGGTVRLLLREGDSIGSSTFFRGFNVASSDVNTVALNPQLASGSAMVHIDASGGGSQLTVVAEEGQSAPGGGTWSGLHGNSSDPRLSPQGDMSFIGFEDVGNNRFQGIYSRARTTAIGTSGATVQARAGSAAPGTGGATFKEFERPTLYDGGMAFRGFLNTNGDNAADTKGQGVWAGAFGSLLPVVRTGDTSAEIPTIPVGSTVNSVWSPFSNAPGSITMRVSLLDSGAVETRAILGSTGGTLRVIAKVGDAAPGLAGETFVNFDHPVIGDGDQIAFAASTNTGSYGVWRQAPGGGALSLIMKVGDTISTSEGNKVISKISLPGGTSEDRKFESRCMDASGRLLIHVTFPDGSTSLLLGN
jgi:hypothetical protein